MTKIIRITGRNDLWMELVFALIRGFIIPLISIAGIFLSLLEEFLQAFGVSEKV